METNFKKSVKERVYTCRKCGALFMLQNPIQSKKFCGKKCQDSMKVKKERPKKKKLKSISSLKKKVWITFSLFIRNRDKWTCITCGNSFRGQQMHAGHFIPRTHGNTLFDEKNVHAQCARCNMFGNGEPHLYAEELIRRYGVEEFNNLIARGRLTKQFTRGELEALQKKYEDHMEKRDPED